MEARLREVIIFEQQYGFIPRKSTADTMITFRMLIENNKGQKKLHCVFVELEKANDRVSRKELLEKYVRLVQDLCKSSMTQ